MAKRGVNGGPILAIIGAGLAAALVVAADAPKKPTPTPSPSKPAATAAKPAASAPKPAASPARGSAPAAKPSPSAAKPEAPAARPEAGAARPETAPAMVHARPAPEHLLLARLAGAWDATVEIKGAGPAAPAQVSKGVETARLCCGGLWLLTDFKSVPPSPPFEGHGVLGYDPSRKRYLSTWVDGAETRPMQSEGVFDAAGRVLTLTGRTERVSGEIVQWTQVETLKDEDHRTFSMTMTGAGGVDSGVFTIAYTRRR